mmetsp:Transcript_8616/g.28169  ORF Transcript_8616/g.28169 Transcript_8616/m.28169 type:complete len:202 (+) Transcript_8616:660-1265(+)
MLHRHPLCRRASRRGVRGVYLVAHLCLARQRRHRGRRGGELGGRGLGRIGGERRGRPRHAPRRGVAAPVRSGSQAKGPLLPHQPRGAAPNAPAPQPAHHVRRANLDVVARRGERARGAARAQGGARDRARAGDAVARPLLQLARAARGGEPSRSASRGARGWPGVAGEGAWRDRRAGRSNARNGPLASMFGEFISCCLFCE